MAHISQPFPTVLRFILLALIIMPSTAFGQQEDPVRVRLMRGFSPRTVIISGTQAVNLYAVDPSNPIQRLNAREKLTITTSNNQVYLRSSNGGIYARSLLVVQDPEAEMTLEIAEGRSIPPPRTYKGAFVIQVDPSSPSTLSIVNEVDLEDYVAGVLASEFNYPELEASKAIAVCIRTLAYRALQNQNGPLFAVTDDEYWQVYQGTGPITRTVVEAVASTQGEVLRYNGELIEAVYFASSGGHTANNEDVWHASEIKTYLRGKEDPYDYNSPHHTWESTIQRDRLLQVLSDRYRFKVTGIRVGDRSRDGRARNVLLSGANNQIERVYSNDFRSVVTENFGRESLKSTLFEINTQPNLYIFTGKGFGHGVGLNQWGALELSRKGNLYGEIIAYYYQDIQLYEELLSMSIADAGDADYYFDDEPFAYGDADGDLFVQEPAVVNAQGAAAAASGVESTLFGDDGGLIEREAPRNQRTRAGLVQANGAEPRVIVGWSARSNRVPPVGERRIGW